jgi:oxaloacetate decarboxylase gamma subunit
MQDLLFQQGVELMLYGMGTVFIFLMLLVILTSLMSALLQRLEKPTAASAPAGSDNNTAKEDSVLIAAITAAIHQHRSRHKR